MKAVAIIVNIFFPGIGTFFVGKIGQAIAQLILYFIGLVLIFTGIGAIVGIPLCVGVWIWGLVSAANSPAQPLQVVIVNKNGAAAGAAPEAAAPILEAAPTQAEPTCSSCGAAVQATDVFCESCGARQAPQRPAPAAAGAAAEAAAPILKAAPTQAGPTCSSCGAAVQATDVFCESCGARLGA